MDANAAKLHTEHYGYIEHIELGYHDYNDVMERGLPDWLVRDSAAYEKMKASGVHELTSSKTVDLDK